MDFRDLEKAAKEQGWRIGASTKGHPVFFPPDPNKSQVFTSGTPSDWRSIKNFLAELKRSGFIWPWPPQGKKK